MTAVLPSPVGTLKANSPVCHVRVRGLEMGGVFRSAAASTGRGPLLFEVATVHPGDAQFRVSRTADQNGPVRAHHVARPLERQLVPTSFQHKGQGARSSAAVVNSSGRGGVNTSGSRGVSPVVRLSCSVLSKLGLFSVLGTVPESGLVESPPLLNGGHSS